MSSCLDTVYLATIMLYLSLVILLVVSCGAFAAVSGAPWVPVFRRDLESVLDDVELKSGETLLELGCGDGRLLAAAARRGAHAVGYEINPFLVLFAKIRLLPYKNAQARFGDLWRVDTSQSDVVMTFLVPRTMPKLKRKVLREMKPGSRLVSYIFALPGVQATISRHHWFVYRFPLQTSKLKNREISA